MDKVLGGITEGSLGSTAYRGSTTAQLRSAFPFNMDKFATHPLPLSGNLLLLQTGTEHNILLAEMMGNFTVNYTKIQN